MKKYQTNDSPINESNAEISLLTNMLNFYIDKYSSSSIEETERHFLISIGSLVDRGELDKDVVKNFLEESGIEGEIPTKKKTSSSSYTRYDDPCGRGSVRSAC